MSAVDIQELKELRDMVIEQVRELEVKANKIIHILEEMTGNKMGIIKDIKEWFKCTKEFKELTDEMEEDEMEEDETKILETKILAKNYYELQIYFTNGSYLTYINEHTYIDLKRMFYWYLYKNTRYYIFYSEENGGRKQEDTFDREQIKAMKFLYPEE